MNGFKIRELVAADHGEIPGRLRARLGGHVLDSTTAARAEALRLTFGHRAGDDGLADVGCLGHEMRNVLTAALLAFEIVAKECGAPETRAIVTLGRNLRRMHVLVERGAPAVPGEA
jgi:hypothetical protein